MEEKKEKQYVSDNVRLLKEWNWEKNTDVSPDQLVCGSKRKVWWCCDKGHEWEAVISSRNGGKGCPYCAGRYVIKGENDLRTVNPVLANEWNYERNNGLSPVDILPNSNKEVWWKCSQGHEWQALIANRSRGKGCPYCSGRYAIKGKNDLQTVNPALANEWNYEINDGLTPVDVMPNSPKKAWWQCSKGHEWQASIANRNKGNGCPYCAGQEVLRGYNDLQQVNPI